MMKVLVENLKKTLKQQSVAQNVKKLGTFT